MERRQVVAAAALAGVAGMLRVSRVEARPAQATDGEIEELARFLVQAKTHGYASGDPRRITVLDDGGRQVRSEAGEFVYRDCYYGEERFSGQEVVWRRGKAVWSLNFYGLTLEGVPVPAAFPDFHKAALRRLSVEMPFRGPRLYRERDLTYVNDVTGDIRRFHGVEHVFDRDVEVFRLDYHGGMLQG